MSQLKMEWAYVGQNSKQTFKESTTHSESTTQEFSNSVQAGIEASGSVGLPFVAEGEVTVSTSYTHTWGKSFTEVAERGTERECTTPCEPGTHIYQWQLRGVDRGADASVSTCSFMCIKDCKPKTMMPKCPKGFCDSKQACQCCNAQWWETTEDDSKMRALLNKDAGGTCVYNDECAA